MHLADPIVGLGVPAHAERGRVEVGRIDALLADQGVGVDAQLLDDLVLQQPMDDDHVRPEELLPAGDLLEDGLAVVDDELEVEVRDPDAGVALAGRRLADVAATPAEPEVAPLDRVEEHRPIDPLGCRVGEGGIALELRQPEVGPECRDDGADEVRQDVLRVVQLDVGEVARVAGDVGDQEAGGLRAWKHRSSSDEKVRLAARSFDRRIGNTGWSLSTHRPP